MFNDKSPLVSRRISTSSRQSEGNEDVKENSNPQKEQKAKKQQQQKQQQQQQKQNANPEKKSQKQMTRAERRALQVINRIYIKTKQK